MKPSFLFFFFFFSFLVTVVIYGFLFSFLLLLIYEALRFMADSFFLHGSLPEDSLKTKFSFIELGFVNEDRSFSHAIGPATVSCALNLHEVGYCC